MLYQSTANKAKANRQGIVGKWWQAVSEDGSALFCSHLALARAVVILISAAISIVQSLFKVIEHMHLSGSHVTF